MIIIKKNPNSNRSKRFVKYNDFSIDSVKSYILNLISEYNFSVKFNKNNDKLFIFYNNHSYYVKLDYDKVGLVLTNKITGNKKYYYNFSSWRTIFNDIQNNILC